MALVEQIRQKAHAKRSSMENPCVAAVSNLKCPFVNRKSFDSHINAVDSRQKHELSGKFCLAFLIYGYFEQFLSSDCRCPDYDVRQQLSKSLIFGQDVNCSSWFLTRTDPLHFSVATLLAFVGYVRVHIFSELACFCFHCHFYSGVK